MTPKDRQSLYKQVLGNEAGRQLLSELNVFCHGTKKTEMFDNNGRIDVNQMLILEGRRQVFTHIMTVLKVDAHTLFEDYIDIDFDME